MATLLVTYDLRKPGQDYSGFHSVIKAHSGWARLSESSYAISTGEAPSTIYDKLRPYMDGNDHVYIIHLRKPYMGFGPSKVNDWLDTSLPTV